MLFPAIFKLVNMMHSTKLWEKNGQNFTKKWPGEFKNHFCKDGYLTTEKGKTKAHCALTDTLFPVWLRRLVTRVASTSIATIIVYAAMFAPSIVEFTLVTVDRFCATPNAVSSPVGRGWIVTVPISCSVGTWAWRQFPRGWLPGSPMAIPWG